MKLSDQQYSILQVLWQRGEASAREVVSELPEDLAHTTVATVMTRLEKKGVLSSATRGRERVYRPLISEDEVQKSMVSGLVSTLFKGDSSALLAHLVRESEIADDDLNNLRQLLDKESDK